MSQRVPFVGGNWKMNTDLAGGVQLAQDVATSVGDYAGTVDIRAYPPFPYLHAVGDALGTSVMLGSQDVWHEGDGAFTGEVSTDMLMDAGAGSVLIGHSERRHVIGETDELVGKKLRRVLEAGLEAVLCVGETLDEREAGQTNSVNERQVRSGLGGVSALAMGSIVIAYEPVWAIGTGKTASPEDAQAAHAAIRSLVAALYSEAEADAVRIIYGGSMKPANAAELLAQPDIDGGLIGGASLKAPDFAGIVEAAASSAG
ncbi:MAG: triose-phosphate isomerase [Planctomycetota bacterium]